MKTEYSLECEICSNYNIQEGVIVDGKIYCWSCMKKPNFKIYFKKNGKKKQKKR